MKKDIVKYSDFYKNNSLYLKEGIVTEADQGVKVDRDSPGLYFLSLPSQEDIARLLMFETSNNRPGVSTSLSQYIERMQEGQKDIYYMYAPRYAVSLIEECKEKKITVDSWQSLLPI